jgi:hypothetical protein
MFKRKSTQHNEQALALIGMISSMANASGKGRGAERMEAMAQVVAAMGFDAESIKSVEIDWKLINGEYCPVLRIKSKEGINEITQKKQK